MKAQPRTWIDYFDPSFEWFARGAIAVGAASVAFMLVPAYTSLRFAAVIAAIFACYHLFGFFKPRLKAFCRGGLGAGLLIGAGGNWILHDQQALILKVVMTCIVWVALTLMLDVLDLPHATYWKGRFRHDRRFGAFDV